MIAAEYVAAMRLRLGELAFLILSDAGDEAGWIGQYVLTHGLDLDAFFFVFLRHLPNRDMTVLNYICCVMLSADDIEVFPSLDEGQAMEEARRAAKVVMDSLGEALLRNDGLLVSAEAVEAFIEAMTHVVELNDEIESRSSTPTNPLAGVY
jgi:hypothetical protein